MRTNLAKYSILAALILFSFSAGVASYKYQTFPYTVIQSAYYQINGNSTEKDWSIGVYEGKSSPFDLKSPPDIINPVLTKEDVTDVDASFIADPFMIPHEDKYYMFFEVLNKENKQGEIGYAVSSDAKKWEYQKIILGEPFHLSYPHVFKWQGDYYLIPESYEDYSVRVYKAKSFPGEWEHVTNILGGYHFVDPTIFRHQNKWWMFVTTPSSDVLNLYYSDNLLENWKPHPSNPIRKNDKHHSRPAGRVLSLNGKLYRFTQDDAPYYGIQVFAFEITELSDTTYADKLISEKPIITKTGNGWNESGMHQIDLHRIQSKWIAIVDGK